MVERAQTTDQFAQSAMEKVFPFYRTWGIIHETPIGADLIHPVASFLRHGIVPGHQLDEYGIESSKGNDSRLQEVFTRQVRFEDQFRSSSSISRPAIAILINPSYYWYNEHQVTGVGESAVYTTKTTIEPKYFQGIIISDSVPRKPDKNKLPSKVGGYQITRKIDISVDEIEHQITEIKSQPFYREQRRIIRKGMAASKSGEIGMSKEAITRRPIVIFYTMYREGSSPPYSTITEPDGTESIVFHLSDDPMDRNGQMYSLAFLSHLESNGQLNERTRVTFAEYYAWLKRKGVVGNTTTLVGDLGIPDDYATKKELIQQKWARSLDGNAKMRELTAKYKEEMAVFQQTIDMIQASLLENNLAIPIYSSDGSLLWPRRLSVQQIIELNRSPAIS